MLDWTLNLICTCSEPQSFGFPKVSAKTVPFATCFTFNVVFSPKKNCSHSQNLAAQDLSSQWGGCVQDAASLVACKCWSINMAESCAPCCFRFCLVAQSTLLVLSSHMSNIQGVKNQSLHRSRFQENKIFIASLYHPGPSFWKLGVGILDSMDVFLAASAGRAYLTWYAIYADRADGYRLRFLP